MPSRRHAQQGFTLIELLAVLVVLAIVAGLAAARFQARSDGAVLEATAQELASRLRAARTAAIRQAADRTVEIDMARRVVTAGAGIAPLPIPDTVGIVSHTSASERRAPRVAGVRFFPNGASTGAAFRLETRLKTGQQAYEIGVNWLTGRISVARLH